MACCEQGGKTTSSSGLEVSPLLPCSCLLVWPSGAIAGYVLSLVGFNYFYEYLLKVEHKLDKVDIKLKLNGIYFTDYINESTNGVIVVAGVVVILYGLREKYRIRFNRWGHLEGWAARGLKFTFKAAVTLLELFGLLLVLVMFGLAEAILVTLLCAIKACDVSGETVVPILNVISSNKFLTSLVGLDDDLGLQYLEKVCRVVGNAQGAATRSMIWSLVMVVGQIIVVLYWMKYSTLALVPGGKKKAPSSPPLSPAPLPPSRKPPLPLPL